MLAVFKRELRAYFTSSTGFIFMGFFLLLSGFFFAMTNLFPASPDYNSVLGSITFIFLIVVPILTMRLMPDDKRQRTDQLLFTSPTSLTGIVLGKYFAACLCIRFDSSYNLHISHHPILLETWQHGR